VKAIRLQIIFLSLLLFPSVAGAQDKKEKPKVVYEQRTEIDFDEMEVTGELVKPQGSVITARKRAVFDSFIKLRVNWDKEMKKSTKEIR
jgi:hypothetical protein